MLHLGCEKRFGKNKKYIHLEILPEEIGDIQFCHVPLVGDAKQNLRNLTALVRKNGFQYKDQGKWISSLNKKLTKNKKAVKFSGE